MTAAIVAAIIGLGVVALMLHVRLSPNPPERWHVDPLSVTRPETPNHHLLRPQDGDAHAPDFALDPDDLARRIDRVARADGAALHAGSVAAGHMTYISRTRWMGFPDFTSVRVLPAPGGATLAAFARARFGRSDLGANRARLERWQDALRADTRP